MLRFEKVVINILKGSTIKNKSIDVGRSTRFEQ